MNRITNRPTDHQTIENGEGKTMKKRFLAIAAVVLSLVMSASSVSLSSFAETQETTENTSSSGQPDDHQNAGNAGGMGGGVAFGAGSRGDGKAVTETDPAIANIISSDADKFTQATYEDSTNGISLGYSLYVPEDYDPSKSYPLLMYIPDASGASKTAEELVQQYFGADVWVTASEQAKHECFVLVPAFSVIVVDDDHNTSNEIDAAVDLLHSLTGQYSIDTNRLYTTGQSMGCMTSLYLNGKYPDLFAASLLVSGQWDISQLSSLTNEKFFYITAGGDTKASGGQTEVMNMLTQNGVSYSYGTWSAQDTDAVQSSAAESLISQGNNANFIRFETGTVLKGGTGMEHNASFVYGYKISAVRDWLFAQSRTTASGSTTDSTADSTSDSTDGAALFQKAEELRKSGGDEATVFQYYLQSAEAGYAEAETEVGDSYMRGHGTDIDYAKAFEWLSKASSEATEKEYTDLGILYLNGWGTETDYAKALELLTAATDMNSMKAPRYVGMIYENGYGTDADYEKAVEYYQLAADRGDITGTYYLGQMYEKGLGVMQDYAKAMELYQKSAERGDVIAAPAITAIGHLYEEGLGVDADTATAKEWYEKAAATGYAEAQTALQNL